MLTIDDKYKEATDFLFSQLPMFSRVGAPAYKPGLETSEALDIFFKYPHKKFRSIHIGGTNGKGSTSHMIASVLQAQGYKVGLYTSPHLVDFRERMKINGEMIPKEKVIDFVEYWKKTGYKGKPSFFELTMMMAFTWFAEEKIDFGIIEVGMGGRLDSTNIISPILSIVTNISHDHNQFLGDTLQQIAYEKAGIIKENIPVVIGEKQNEVKEIFVDKALEKSAPISFASDLISVIISAGDSGIWKINYKGIEINLPLGGDYQKKNIITVLAAIENLMKEGVEISYEAVKSGIENVVSQTGFQGRWTILNQQPLIITDTGHNLAGISSNFKQLKNLQQTHPGSTLHIVIGFVADKALDKMLGYFPKDARYYATNAKIPRALPSEKLCEFLIKEGLDVKNFPNVKEAFESAKKEASEKDIIFIGGSTFIVADLLE